MDFSLQSGNQISLKRDDKPSAFAFMTRKVNGDIDYINIVLMGIASAFIFACIGMYFYNSSLASSVLQKKAILDQKQTALKSLPIDQIRLLYSKLQYANDLTKNYSYTDTLFSILGKTVENTIYYNKIDLSRDKSGDYSINLTGEADSYKNLAQQINTLFTGDQLKYFSDTKLQSFSLDKKTGKVQFRLSAVLRFRGITPDADELLLLGTDKPTVEVPSTTSTSTP